MRQGLNNPLPVIGSGYYYADLTGVAAVTQGIGTSPWMVSYLAITLGWARQTRALAVGNGYLFERSAAKFGLRYVNGALHRSARSYMTEAIALRQQMGRNSYRRGTKWWRCTIRLRN